MKITILVDNITLTDKYYIGESGLSLYIEADRKKILFDTGYSDILLVNARKMGIDLRNIDYIVLSHGHADHTGGLVHFLKYYFNAKRERRLHKTPIVVAHPYCFYRRPKLPLRNIGFPLAKAMIEEYFPTKTTKQPLWLTKRLVFLGEVERTQPFERSRSGGRRIVMPNGKLAPDYFLDDSALVYRARGGLIIMTGCSHAGICNIVSYAQKVCNEPKIIDIIGGFHLNKQNQRVNLTARFLSNIAPEALHTSHCTSLAAKCALASVLPVHETGVGLNLVY